MKIWIKKIQSSIEHMNHYFRESQEVIAANNLLLIKGISVCGFLVVSLLALIAHLLIPDWKISVGHVLFLPFFAVYFLWANYRTRAELFSQQVNKHMVLSYMCVFMALVIYIETIPYPDKLATLVTPTMIMLPVVFILPISATFLYLVASYIVFLIFSIFGGDSIIIRGNAFNGLVGLLFGFLIAWIVTNLRAHEEFTKQIIIKKSQEDKLTGIYNKSTVEQECFTYLDLYGDENCVLIVLDVDSFKNVNDTYGHQSGDQVLSILGATLTKVFRDQDIVGRIGGDEFLVLMKNVSEKEMVIKRMSYFSELFTKTVQTRMNIMITSSYGAIVKDTGYMSYVPLFEEADKLLYQSKNDGRARGCVRTMSELQKDQEEMKLAASEDNIKQDV